MRIHRFSPIVVAILTYYQILGPIALWAANEQRGLQIERRGRNIVTSIQGDVTRRGDASSDIRPLLFKDILNLGDEIRTTEEGSTQILLGSSGLVTLGPHTSIQLNQEDSGEPVLTLRKGQLELAAAKNQMQPGEIYTIQTPQGRITTEGGLLQIQVRQSDSATALEQPHGTPHLVRTSSTTRLVPVALTSPTIETITVREGSASVASTRTAQEAQTVEAGQTLQLGENTPKSFDSLSEPARDALNICATNSHCETPEPAKELVQTQQLSEAQALSQVLVGAGEESTEGQAQTDEDVILATTAGVALSSSTGGEALLVSLFGPGGGTGAGNQGVGGGNGSVNGTLFGEGNGTLSGFGNGIGGGDLTNDFKSGSGVLDDDSASAIILDIGGVQNGFQFEGGAGLLVFTEREPLKITFNGPENLPISELNDPDNFSFEQDPQFNVSSNFSAETELLVVDSGDLSTAPHQGIPPTSTLVVRGITEDNISLTLNKFSERRDPDTGEPFAPFGIGVFSTDGLGITSPDIGFVPDTPETRARAAGANSRVAISKSSEDANREIFVPINDDVEGVFANPPRDPVGILGDFSSGTTPETINRTCRSCSDGNSEGFIGSGNFMSLINGAVTARSPDSGTLNDRLVILNGGVVLDQMTMVTIGDTPATNDYFGINGEFDGSLIGFIAKDSNPAIARINNRALAVLNQSTISKQNNKNVALLSVLDSQLSGPTEPPMGNDVNGNAVPLRTMERDGNNIAITSPLLDIGNPGGGSNQQNQATVEVTSAAVIRSTGVESDVLVPDALLQLESPLMSLISSTVTTNSHFADFQTTRPNDLLFSTDFSSNVEKQKAVLVVDNSTVTVENGHLVHVQQGHMQITDGVIFSNTNGGNIDIQNGTFVNLTDGANFTLAHHAFGGFESFDSSNTGLSVDNSLCASGNCETLTALNGFEYEGLRVAGVSSQEDLLERVKVPRLFVPFLFENNQPDDDQPLNAFVADQNTAFLNVAGGSTLTVTLPLEFAQNHPDNLEALSQTDTDVTVNFPGGGGLLVFGDTSGLTRTTSVCAGVGDNQTCQQNADNSAVLVEQAVENPGAGTKTTTTFVLTELNSLNANSELERQNEFNGGTRVVDGTPQVEPITQILNTSQLTATTELLLVDGEAPDPSAPELETLIITGHQGDITEVPDTAFFAPAGIPVSETNNQARLVVHSPIATPLEISGGIILADASSLTTTQDVVAVVNSGNNPASVTFDDRVLAVLEESTLTSEAALLNIVGSHVQGPSAPNLLRTDNGGNPLISPLLDIFARTTKPDLSNPALDSDVTVTSAIVVQSNGELNDVDLGQRQVNGVTIDRGILDASAPLITLVNSVMTATSHGIDLQGSPDDTHAIFTAGLPNDALVVVDGSLLTIQTGNLVNLNNGSATVSGLLFSIANGGHLNIANGALVGLSGTSQFNLVSNAFGAFSGATDTLTINNGLCSSGCTPLLDATGTPFAPLPNGTQLQVAGGGTVSITSPSFTPFLAPEVPNIDIGPDDAFLNVEENATVTISAN